MIELNPLILLVEDEPQMRRFLRSALKTHEYRLLEAGSVTEGLAMASSHNPQLVLLDLGLPDGDGLDFTTQIRQWSKVPIVVISARGREEDKVAALDAGADDYLTKPFGINELLARMRASLRHAQAPETAATTYDFNDLHIDLAKRLVTLAGNEVHLTPTVYKLLLLLAQHAGKVLTHRQILQEVWGPAYANQTHYVRVHMAELRKKIEPDPMQQKLIVTEPGVGYRLKPSS